MAGEITWFADDPTKPTHTATNGDRILQHVQGQVMFYGAEVSEDLELDPRTVTKWLKRLVRVGKIKRVDMSILPNPEQLTRIKELRAAGMKTNHLQNAKWYVASEDNDRVENDAGN